MTGVELLNYVERVEREQGIDFVVLTVTRRPRGVRMKLFDGCFGVPVGSNKQGTQVATKIADIKRALARNLHHIERHAIRIAERGQLATAERHLAEYQELASRLAGVR
jgi:hypothetical protein